MTLTPWKKLSAVILGDDLHVALVSGSPLGVRVRRGPTLRRFLSMPESEARAALEPLASGARVTLTCPASCCALRPIQMSARQWEGAREEVERSIDRLLPIPASDAMVGVIDVGEEAGAGGCLVAVRRSLVAPWIDAIGAATQRPILHVLSPHMAMLGLGLQGEARADVIEPGPHGGALRHELAWGRPVALGEPDHADEALAHGTRVTLPGESEQPVAGEIEPHQLAIAAAMAPVVAPGVFAPLLGPTPPLPKRWIPPAVGAAAALALFLAGPAMWESRLVRATDSLRAEHATMQDRVDSVQALRQQAERYGRLVNEGVAQATSEWGSVLPTLIDAQRSLGDRGYFYRLEVTTRELHMVGEAGNATGVLERLETSEALTSARITSPVTTSNQTGLETIDVRVDRASRRGGVR
ncbi:MAG: hypothetical protein EA376_08585 [Phycisphaeraceae bacterium]|nr:MAG: hypothetical protein EA376_08585 [Phycisphaeraceae bacterium]